MLRCARGTFLPQTRRRGFAVAGQINGRFASNRPHRWFGSQSRLLVSLWWTAFHVCNLATIGAAQFVTRATAALLLVATGGFASPRRSERKVVVTSKNSRANLRSRQPGLGALQEGTMRPTSRSSEIRQLIRDILIGALVLACIGAAVSLGSSGLELIAMR
jgi:hypothetical protein